jgi:hypothetical protein
LGVTSLPTTGSAIANANVSSKYLQMQAPPIHLDAGVITVAAPKPVTVDFIPSEPLRRRYLAAINPIFRDVRLADEKKPIRFTVDAVKYSLDGNRAANGWVAREQRRGFDYAMLG